MLTILVISLAFYFALNLGANDVANAMGTSVGSQAITLKQALIIAGILEFAGAVLFGEGVTGTLATKIVNPSQFADTPSVLVLGMVAVLISCGGWLQIATLLGLPVSSSHAVVGAIAGFSWVGLGLDGVNWHSLGLITLGWLILPVMSGAIAALFYSQIRHWILDTHQPWERLNEWIPWLSTILVGVLGIIILPQMTQPLQTLLHQYLTWEIPTSTITLIIVALLSLGLSIYLWQLLTRLESPSNFSPEVIFSRYQVCSACCVAFAHGSNDVGNAIAPLATILTIQRFGAIPQSQIEIPLWILILGGLGIVTGLALLGKNVITTVGEGIINLQPSDGFCAELATATTILLASNLGLPASTSHALIGGVVGIGLVKNPHLVKFTNLYSIFTAWVVTVPISAGLAAISFSVLRIFLI
ncbi:phosphate transporter [Calothrix sp. NIES-3974]|nr:phosphate transporter [Calothrix sp. NIES-3974]